MEIISEWGKIAGFAGLALGVFVFLFRATIALKIFSKLNQKQSYLIIRWFLILVSIVSFFSIGIAYFNEPSSTQLTVYVYGPKGKQDIILENIGMLIVDFANDRRTPMIGQNGRTNFGEIPKKFLGKEIGIGLIAEGYKLNKPEKLYKMDGNPIYIPVIKEGNLGSISGIVKNRDGSIFLKDVLIMIGNDTSTITNEFGIFKITLPENMRVPNDKIPYLLTIKKEGFSVKTVYYYPSSKDQEIRLDLK
ncbi:MAG TPA: hypothetical protein DCR40_07245 [Prolixibacteraceae bacterium]|nr:hypothetical protein [Prolixibacteraceae bacterium]